MNSFIMISGVVKCQEYQKLLKNGNKKLWKLH